MFFCGLEASILSSEEIEADYFDTMVFWGCNEYRELMGQSEVSVGSCPATMTQIVLVLAALCFSKILIL